MKPDLNLNDLEFLKHCMFALNALIGKFPTTGMEDDFRTYHKIMTVKIDDWLAQERGVKKVCESCGEKATRQLLLPKKMFLCVECLKKITGVIGD